MPLPSPSDLEYIQSLTRKVREGLMPTDHGLWFKFLGPRARRTKPLRTPEFLELYGFDSEQDLPKDTIDLVLPEYRRSVHNAISVAMREPTRAVECTFQAKTRDHQLKWIHARVRRFTLEDGREVLASMHTDVTRLQERQRFYEEVLNTLPGFVFVKEERKPGDPFVFRYVNRELAENLGLTDPKAAEGKTDADFLDNKTEIARFLAADQTAASGEVVETSEETFTCPNGKRLRLATNKMPFPTSLFDPAGITRPCILGVAIDITSITDLLRAVINESPDAIYAKNARQQYVITNPTFLRMLRLPENTDITNKTFRDIVSEYFLESSDAERRRELESLIEAVEGEDCRILADSIGHILRHIHEWPDVLGRQREIAWQTRKTLVPAGTENRVYILGICRNIYDIRRVAHALLDKIPVGFCLKNDKFQIVWCNREHALRHGYDDPEKLIGLTDYDLWPEDKYGVERAAFYRKKDEEVLTIAKSFGHDPIRVKEELAKGGFTKYPEQEFRFENGGQRVTTLEKNKWPELIGDSWHVALVYTDITHALRNVRDYHKFTVHSIKNQFSAFVSAQDQLKLFLDRGSPEHIREALSAIQRGSDSFTFFTEHLLKFLSGEIRPQKVCCDKIVKMITDRVNWTNQVENRILEAHINCLDQVHKEFVYVDEEYLTAVVMEILRNAAEAIRGRNRLVKRQEAEATCGKVTVSLKIAAPATDLFKLRNLCIEIEDNGDASVDDWHWARLVKNWEAARREASEGVRQAKAHFGLTFMHDTIHRHRGSMNLERKNGTIAVQIFLPLAKPQGT